MDRISRVALITILFVGILAVGAGERGWAAAPEPTVSGNQIVDATDGSAFVPRGVNWPSFEYACAQGWGYANPGADRRTAEAMLNWKINTVRIPLNQDCWLGDDGLPMSMPPVSGLTASGYRDAVEDFVEILSQAGIVAMLDLHWSGPPGTVADGLRPMPDSRAPAFWASVASRFSANPSVIFDLFNEPHSRWDPDREQWAFVLDWQCWADGGCRAPLESDVQFPLSGQTYETVGMRELVTVVRNKGAEQPIVLSGLDYANDPRRWSEFAPDDGQLIAGFHNYPIQRCSDEACWDEEVLPLHREVPVVATEFGQNDCEADHLQRFMDWADNQSMGYLAWAWWVLPEEKCSNYSLIEDLDGTPAEPLGTTLRANLIAAAAEPPPEPPPEPPTPEPSAPKPPFTGPTGPAVEPTSPDRAKSQIRRAKAKLRITRLSYRPPRLAVRARINRRASRRIAVRVRLGGRGRSKLVRTKLRVRGGSAKLRTRVRGRWRKVRVRLKYFGDQRVRPDRAVRVLRRRSGDR